jgi:hypothetical protein
MAATTRATSRNRTNRELSVVTRHGLRSPQAAILPIRRMPRGVPAPSPLPPTVSSGLISATVYPRQDGRWAGSAEDDGRCQPTVRKRAARAVDLAEKHHNLILVYTDRSETGDQRCEQGVLLLCLRS